MNPLQNLIAMGLTWTTLIEFIILLFFFLLFRAWFAFLILFGFIGFILFKIYQYFQFKKLSERTTIFNQEIPKVMKAAYYSSNWKKIIDFGEYIVPFKLKDDELLIKVHSASLNPVDYKFVITRFPFYRWIHFPNFGIGNDFAGEVVRIGGAVTKYRNGDFVFGFACTGSFQEYTITKENWIHNIPEKVECQFVAALPMAGVESYQALTYFLKFAPDNIYKEYGEEPDLSGKNILVVGATGGCGHIAIQLAKFLQANEVYGICSKEKVDIIKDLNVCTDVIAYDAIDIDSALDSALLTEDGQPKLDLILDTVTSPESGDVGYQYKKYLKPDGKYVSLNSNSYLTFFKGLLVSWIPKLNLEKKGTHCHMLNRDDTTKALDVLSNMIAQDKFKFITQNFNFEYQAIDDAIKMLRSRKTTGKLVCDKINDNNDINDINNEI